MSYIFDIVVLIVKLVLAIDTLVILGNIVVVLIAGFIFAKLLFIISILFVSVETN